MGILDQLKRTRPWGNTTGSIPYNFDDMDEVERLTIAHHCYKEIWEGNYRAPVESLLTTKGAKVLEAGAGTCHWVFEMATEFPNAEFTAIDINPAILPTHGKPNNVNLLVGDVKNLPFPNNEFDYVHIRHLKRFLSNSDWKTVLAEAVRVLRPGGYLEWKEGSYAPTRSGPVLSQLLTKYTQCYEKMGRDPSLPARLGQVLDSLPKLKAVCSETRDAKMGSWAGELGVYVGDYHIPIILRTLAKSKEIRKLDQSALLADIWAELDKHKVTVALYCAYAQKS